VLKHNLRPTSSSASSASSTIGGGRAATYYMNTLTIRIPDSLRSEPQEISSRRNMPVSDLVRESLRRYVAIEQFRSLRKRVLPFAEAQGLLTDEDVFRAMS
jgi:predicted transcriptional regulator